MQSIIVFVVWAGTLKLKKSVQKLSRKSAKCALSMAFLRVAMGKLVGLMEYLFWFLKDETYDCGI